MTVQTAAGFAALPKTASPGSPITSRQRQVLALVAEGRSNAQIARELFMAEATVATQVTRILRKLEVPNRAAAVNRAWQQGLLPYATTTVRRTP